MKRSRISLIPTNHFKLRCSWVASALLLLFLLYGESEESTSSGEALSSGQCDKNSCAKKPRRYVLYNVNPGEGFNLRRDIFVRVAPLVVSLNKHDTFHEWVLVSESKNGMVLPPWGMVPHWKRTSPDKYFPWRTFFQVERIQQYVPALELEDFMNEYGYDNPIDVVFQLQHFPFDESGDWSDKIESGVRCENELEYKRNPDSKFWTGLFWNQPLLAKSAKCMSFRGQSSALRQFILDKKFSAIMFDRSEVILWDAYGQGSFWEARESLVFAQNLQNIAFEFIKRIGLTPSINISSQDLSGGNNTNTKMSLRREYLGTHLRRADFMLGRLASELPTIPSTARQIMRKLRALGISDVFIATDATKMEVTELKNQIQSEMPGAAVYSFRSEKLTDGECAIIDQIICSFSKYFIGTRDSTFTLRIFEERELLGFSPDVNFNYLCPDQNEMGCDKATQWRKA